MFAIDPDVSIISYLISYSPLRCLVESVVETAMLDVDDGSHSITD